MDLEKSKVLLCALEKGSLTAAAEQLGYTPSGISRGITALEEETGLPLLLRGRLGVQATSACEMLLPSIRELVRWGERCDQLAAQLRGLDTGSITVGTAYHTYDRWLARLAADFSRQYPGIRVHILEGTSSELAALMEQGQADFALISRREGKFRWRCLRRDPIMVWVPQNHPSAGTGRFPMEKLLSSPFIELYPGQETDNSRFLAQQGIRPDVRYATADVYTAGAMVEAGLGVALMNGLLQVPADYGVKALPLEPSQEVEIGVAQPPKEACTPAAKRFGEFAEERLAELRE